MIQSLVDMAVGSPCEQCLKQAKGPVVRESRESVIEALPSYLISITNAKLSGYSLSHNLHLLPHTVACLTYRTDALHMLDVVVPCICTTGLYMYISKHSLTPIASLTTSPKCTAFSLWQPSRAQQWLAT